MNNDTIKFALEQEQKFDSSQMDAKLWADEFCRLNRAADHGMMLAWFANAIMAGFDEAARRAATLPAPEAGKAGEHSQLPWRITEPNERKGREIVCARGSTIAKLTALDLPNAELIVARVNSTAPEAAPSEPASVNNALLRSLENMVAWCDGPRNDALEDIYQARDAIANARKAMLSEPSQAVTLTDSDILDTAHRMAWRYKHSSDPHHSHTYTFTNRTMVEFTRRLLCGSAKTGEAE